MVHSLNPESLVHFVIFIQSSFSLDLCQLSFSADQSWPEPGKAGIQRTWNPNTADRENLCQIPLQIHRECHTGSLYLLFTINNGLPYVVEESPHVLRRRVHACSLVWVESHFGLPKTLKLKSSATLWSLLWKHPYWWLILN